MSALNLTNKILSVVIILLTLGLGLISASPSESDDDSGRVTPPTAAVAAVDPTPGQQARKNANYFIDRREYFKCFR